MQHLIFTNFIEQCLFSDNLKEGWIHWKIGLFGHFPVFFHNMYISDYSLSDLYFLSP
jgi:hypothetical protein